MAKPQKIRDHIAYFLQEAVKAYDIEAVCDRLGMPVVEDAWTHNSKRVYAQNRLASVPAADLTQIARRVIEEFDDPELEQLLERGGFRGVDGALKNIILAADGAKPRIVMSDALNNTIDIVEGRDRCLIYDRPLPASGLTWVELVDWWAVLHGVASDRTAATSLYKRLARSLASPPEELLFKTYCERYIGDGPRRTQTSPPRTRELPPGPQTCPSPSATCHDDITCVEGHERIQIAVTGSFGEPLLSLHQASGRGTPQTS